MAGKLDIGRLLVASACSAGLERWILRHRHFLKKLDRRIRLRALGEPCTAPKPLRAAVKRLLSKWVRAAVGDHYLTVPIVGGGIEADGLRVAWRCQVQPDGVAELSAPLLETAC